MRVIILALLFISINGCGNSADDYAEQEIYVDHYKAECYGFKPEPCIRTRSSLEEEWGNFYDQIEGFDYEWGYVYKLKIRIYELYGPNETPEDASGYKYKLDAIISKQQQPASSTFDFAISRSYGSTHVVVEQDTGIYEMFGEKRFECIPEMCSEIDSLITQDYAILFQFSHNEIPSAPLQLVQIKCSSSREAFMDSCLAGSQSIALSSSGNRRKGGYDEFIVDFRGIDHGKQ